MPLRINRVKFFRSLQSFALKLHMVGAIQVSSLKAEWFFKRKLNGFNHVKCSQKSIAMCSATTSDRCAAAKRVFRASIPERFPELHHFSLSVGENPGIEWRKGRKCLVAPLSRFYFSVSLRAQLGSSLRTTIHLDTFCGPLSRILYIPALELWLVLLLHPPS